MEGDPRRVCVPPSDLPFLRNVRSSSGLVSAVGSTSGHPDPPVTSLASRGLTPLSWDGPTPVLSAGVSGRWLSFVSSLSLLPTSIRLVTVRGKSFTRTQFTRP